MQGSKGTSQRTRRDQGNATEKGRVIDMRAWKAKRRSDRFRQKRSRFDALVWLTACLSAAAAVSALIGCIPFAGQVNSILLAWLFAVLSAALGSILFALGRRYARLLLTVDVLAMAVSFVAAFVLYVQLPR